MWLRKRFRLKMLSPCRSAASRIAVTAFLASRLFAQSTPQPNFSGEWHMDAAKSDFGKFQMPTVMIRVIVQKDPDLTIDTTQRGVNGEQTSRVYYRTDGEETVNHMSSGVGTSHAFWDGKALVIRTTMKGRNDVDIQMEERWDLSADGKTLTTTSHIGTTRGSADLKLVCERAK
jgi:hypothetical protein